MDKYYGVSAGSAQAIGLQQSGLMPKPPALGNVFSAIERLSEACERSRNVANALAGTQPESAGQSVSAAPNGMFDELDKAAERIDAYASSILSDMSRISNRL